MTTFRSSLAPHAADDPELSHRAGMAMVAGAGVIFSFGALLFRAAPTATDWQFLVYRGAGTTVALLLLVALRGVGTVDRAAFTFRSVVASMLLATMSIVYILALARTTAATVLFLLAAAPVFGALFGWVLLRERVNWRTWTVMAVTAVGVLIMVDSGLGEGSGTGLVLAACIPVALGMYNVLIRSDGHSDPLMPALMAGMFLTTVSVAVAVSTEGLGVPLRDALCGLAAGGLLLGIGLPLFNTGHRAVPTAQVSLLLMTEIVLAPLWVWIWPGETPSGGTIIGGAIVLVAVAALAVFPGPSLLSSDP